MKCKITLQLGKWMTWNWSEWVCACMYEVRLIGLSFYRVHNYFFSLSCTRIVEPCTKFWLVFDQFWHLLSWALQLSGFCMANRAWLYCSSGFWRVTLFSTHPWLQGFLSCHTYVFLRHSTSLHWVFQTEAIKMLWKRRKKLCLLICF